MKKFIKFFLPALLTCAMIFTLIIPSVSAMAASSTRVYFYNSGNWAKVNAYVYNDAKTVTLGDWPGTAAIKDSSSNWWYVDVPADAALSSFNIIFNDGNGNQSGGAYINDATNVYVTIKADGKFSSKTAAVSSLGTTSASTKVWFYNSGSWAKVNAYVYNDAKSVTLGDWPGIAATKDSSSNWWYVNVPADAAVNAFSIIFNDGSGNQSGGAYINDSANVYITVKADGKFSSKADAVSSLPATSASMKVWFYNSSNWDKVNAYVYNDAKSVTLGGWPGTAATKDSSSNWWYVNVPADASVSAFNIIFNDGNGNQSGGAYINDNSSVYVTVKADGKFSGKPDAEASISSNGASTTNSTTDTTNTTNTAITDNPKTGDNIEIWVALAAVSLLTGALTLVKKGSKQF